PDALSRARQALRDGRCLAPGVVSRADVDRAAPAGTRTGPVSARDRGSSTRLRRPREPRDRQPPVPLRGDREEPRAPYPREAAGKVKSPRRSGWLPAWAHQLTRPKLSAIAADNPPMG